MKTHGAAVVALFSVLAVSGQTPPAHLSPAQQKMAWAQKAIEENSERYQPHNDLALALSRRARETSDPAYYAQAEEALRNSFRLAPDNFEGQKVRAWILLGKHEFAQALEAAKALNRRAPDDILVYGLLADAHIELGNYQEAEEAAQWMLDMRPGNVPGLTRAAYLRELFGDIDGAIELMNAAYQRTPYDEVEDRAWILTHIAHLQLMTGKADGAEKVLQRALELFPGYHYALANLARVRIVQQRHAEAIDLLRQRFQAAPYPENLYGLAEALEQAGRLQEAKVAYADFEEKARREMDWADNANRELIFYYADHAQKPAEALRLARHEAERRRDVQTLDTYAWALCVNGEYAEARKQIESALAVGIHDAKFFYHAGAIASKLNDQATAARYLTQSLDLNPVSEFSTAARKALATVSYPAAGVAGRDHR
ncbi:MAG: tetratricopeptide repeat protein [Acidobacteria bacterium]|nr:tetratricopeptide repeat protein [Acidobacteriota bacterium]